VTAAPTSARSEALSGPAASLALLRQRAARTLDALDGDLSLPSPTLPRHFATARRFVATGAGGSEGPARAFVAALEEQGIAARFRPLSTFALRDVDDAAVVLFSQGLSPNARIALSGSRPTVIVTAVDPADEGAAAAAAALRLAMGRGAIVWSHGPRDENRLLLRVEGPARATLAGLRLAAAIAPCSLPADLAVAARRAARIGAAPLAPHPVALVTAGDAGPYAHGLRWKLLEGLGVADPPVWDVLQVAHGPLQQFYEAPITLLCLEGEGQTPLFDRLARTLVPGRHAMRRLFARLPHPWSWFEHDAQLNALVIATLARRPRDLIDWPGKGRDGSLYDLAGR
jgi:hypothetical protein